MRFITTSLIFFSLAFCCFGQDKQVIRWSGSDAPKDCCVNFMRNNLLHTAYFSDDLDYLLVLETDSLKDYISVIILVKNNSDKMTTINPATFKIRMTEPINQDYVPTASAEVAKKLKNNGKWRSVLASVFAGMATRQTTATVRDNRGNQANVIVTERDDRAIAAARQANRERQAINNAKADEVAIKALPSHTLFKDEFIGGSVYFKKVKPAPGLILSFEIENITYEVPFGKERTKQN